MIYTFLLLVISVGAPSTILGVRLSLKEEMVFLAVTNIVFYLWVWILFFKRSLSYTIRAGSLIAYSYIIGLQFLIVTGPFGAGPSILFTFPVATGVLLKPRFAFFALIVNLVTLIGFGGLIMSGFYEWPFLHVQPMETWTVVGLNFMLMSGLVTISIVLIFQGLKKTLNEKESTLNMLEVRNEELHTANRRIQSEMDAKEKAWSEKEKMRIEKQVVEKTNRAIADWVNFIAHEIRSHITGPLSYSQLGLRKTCIKQVEKIFSIIDQSPAKIEKPAGSDGMTRLNKDIRAEYQTLGGYFQQILNASYGLQHLLDELLDLSKLESGQISLEIRHINIKSVFEETILEMQATLFEKQLRLISNHSDIETEVECDGFRIGQLLRNLLSNAIKFTPPGKGIEINCRENRVVEQNPIGVPALIVTVADEGIGIPQDQVTDVFEKFKQSRKTRKGDGTGLGLPICREIVHAHRGKIWVESKEQEGSSFHFAIPINAEDGNDRLEDVNRHDEHLEL